MTHNDIRKIIYLQCCLSHTSNWHLVGQGDWFRNSWMPWICSLSKQGMCCPGCDVFLFLVPLCSTLLVVIGHILHPPSPLPGHSLHSHRHSKPRTQTETISLSLAGTSGQDQLCNCVPGSDLPGLAWPEQSVVLSLRTRTSAALWSLQPATSNLSHINRHQNYSGVNMSPAHFQNNAL